MKTKSDILENIINDKDKTHTASVTYKTSCYLCFRNISGKPIEFIQKMKHPTYDGILKVYFHKKCLDDYIHFKEELKNYNK